MPHAIIVDDDRGIQEAITAVAEQEGFAVTSIGSLADARRLLAEQVPDVALVDLKLPDGTGFDLVSEIAANAPGTDIVLITGHATVDSVVDAFREGISDFLTKPIEIKRLQAVLGNVSRRCELRDQVQHLRDELRGLGRFGVLIGASPAMQEVYDLISRVAPKETTVFVQGESGTGKELVAQTVHELSRRRKQPFVAINCGAVTPQLIESELFGHERGSFTGAERVHRGYFERASGGTLFLDEVTEMPPELQVKLLRVLETGRITRVGGEREIPVDVRLVAATNREPQAAVADGKFRQDLLYRLSVFPIPIPPLRARGGDLELLLEHFLAQLGRDHKTRKRVSSAALARLRAHSWPGNVRELKNVVERAYILADSEITPECLPALDSEVTLEIAATSLGPTIEVHPGMSIAEAEKRLVLATLESCDGNKERAAKILKISLKTLYNRLNAYNGRGVGKTAAA